MTDIDIIIQDYVVTLNGITADVIPCGNNIMLHNGSFNHSSEKFDIHVLPKQEFVKLIVENNGKFQSGG